jgi:hypothetical protein
VRCMIFAPALLSIGSFALADDRDMLDLDRPGVLEQLKQEHPSRYQAVQGVLAASEQAPCAAGRLELFETGLNVRDAECGMSVVATYPALRHVRFVLDGVRYAATVVLHGDDRLTPASAAFGNFTAR